MFFGSCRIFPSLREPQTLGALSNQTCTVCELQLEVPIARWTLQQEEPSQTMPRNKNSPRWTDLACMHAQKHACRHWLDKTWILWWMILLRFEICINRKAQSYGQVVYEYIDIHLMYLHVYQHPWKSVSQHANYKFHISTKCNEKNHDIAFVCNTVGSSFHLLYIFSTVLLVVNRQGTFFSSSISERTLSYQQSTFASWKHARLELINSCCRIFGHLKSPRRTSAVARLHPVERRLLPLLLLAGQQARCLPCPE